MQNSSAAPAKIIEVLVFILLVIATILIFHGAIGIRPARDFHKSPTWILVGANKSQKGRASDDPGSPGSFYQRENHRNTQKKCDLSVVRGTWTKSFAWNNSGCIVKLDRSQLAPFFSGHTRVIFLGDSQMSNIVRFLFPRLQCKIVKKGSRCGQVRDYLGLPPPTQYRKPNSSRLEGPIGYGLKRRGCMDCNGCMHRYSVCNASTNDASSSSRLLVMEFLGVEFARDFELQSALASTTQVLNFFGVVMTCS
jgi:hypothetical protein